MSQLSKTLILQYFIGDFAKTRRHINTHDCAILDIIGIERIPLNIYEPGGTFI